MFFIVIKPDYTTSFAVQYDPNQNPLNSLTPDNLGIKNSDIINLYYKREN
jgi:hypothetical protein